VEQPAFADTDLFFRHVADENVQGAKILPAACTVQHFEKGLSVEWSRRSTPADTVRGTSRSKVIAVTVRDCRALGLEIVHDPVNNNEELNSAHCLLFFPPNIGSRSKKTELRDRFLDLCRPITVRWYHHVTSFLRYRRYHRREK
jgi:hypothetical protein